MDNGCGIRCWLGFCSRLVTFLLSYLTLSLLYTDVDQRASIAEDLRTEVGTRPLETSWWAGKTNSAPPPLVESERRNGTASSPILTICRYGTYRLFYNHDVD